MIWSPRDNPDWYKYQTGVRGGGSNVTPPYNMYELNGTSKNKLPFVKKGLGCLWKSEFERAGGHVFISKRVLV